MNTYASKDCTGAAGHHQLPVGDVVHRRPQRARRPAADPRPQHPLTKTQLLGFSGPPGAISYEIKYAKDATVAADGSLSALNVQDALPGPRHGPGADHRRA